MERRCVGFRSLPEAINTTSAAAHMQRDSRFIFHESTLLKRDSALPRKKCSIAGPPTQHHTQLRGGSGYRVSTCRGATHLFGVSPRWLAEKPGVFAAELRCTRVPHVVGDRRRARGACE